jgi:hypothetical protein
MNGSDDPRSRQPYRGAVCSSRAGHAALKATTASGQRCGAAPTWHATLLQEGRREQGHACCS